MGPKTQKMYDDLVEAAFQRSYLHYKDRAKAKNRTFNLSYKRFKALRLSNCAYCDLPASDSNTLVEKKPFVFRANGIDRVNNNLGYTYQNSVSCCILCNNTKNDWTVQDWLEWIHRIALKTKESPLRALPSEQTQTHWLKRTRERERWAAMKLSNHRTDPWGRDS